MKESLRLRLDQLSDRHEELTALLADVEVISDNKRFRQLSREHSDLSEITEVWTKYKQAEADIETAEAMLSDPDFKEMAVEEIKENKAIIILYILRARGNHRGPHEKGNGRNLTANLSGNGGIRNNC